MIPTNTKNNGCVPVSSNCIQWQGPDIPFLNLCKGASITEVAYGIANQVKEIMDWFNISEYDITCLNQGKCGPSDIKEMLQVIISKFCENNISQEGFDENTIVEIPECLQKENSDGEKIKQDTIESLVKLTSKKLCTLFNDFNELTETVDSNTQNINKLLTDVENLQDEKQDKLDNNQNDHGNNCFWNSDIVTEIDNIAKYLCGIREVIGEDTDVLRGIETQCVNSNDYMLSNPTQQYQQSPNWCLDQNTIGDSISNIWVVLCDIRRSVSDLINSAPTAGIDFVYAVENCCNNIIFKIKTENDTQVEWDDTATLKILKSGSIISELTINSFNPKSLQEYTKPFANYDNNLQYTVELEATYTKDGNSHTVNCLTKLSPFVSNLTAELNEEHTEVTVEFDSYFANETIKIYCSVDNGTATEKTSCYGSTHYKYSYPVEQGSTYKYTLRSTNCSSTDCFDLVKEITVPADQTRYIEASVELESDDDINNAGSDIVNETLTNYANDNY